MLVITFTPFSTLAAPEREEDATLLPSNQLAAPLPTEFVVVDEDEDASFIATETEPV